MTRAWCVRADWGTYTHHFRDGGFVGIGWDKLGELSQIETREEIYPLCRVAYPDDKSNTVVGIQVGQAARFLLEITPGDVVIAGR